MGRIYSEAAVVIMWLGLEASKSDLAMDLLCEFQDLVKPDVEWDSTKYQSLAFDTSYNAHWTALRRLFDRPYWSRVWILQEVVLTRRACVQCGTRMVSWNILSTLAANHMSDLYAQQSWHARGTFSQSPFVTLLARLDREYIEGNSLSMLDGLLLSRQRYATKAHDHIYAILSLVNLNGFLMESTYEKPVATLFRDIVCQTIVATKSLDILTACKEFDLSDLRPAFEKRTSPYVRRRPHGVQIHFTPKLVFFLATTARLRQQLATLTDAQPDDENSKENLVARTKDGSWTLKTRDPPQSSPLSSTDSLSDMYRAVSEEFLKNPQGVMKWIPLEAHELPITTQLEGCHNAWPSWVPDWSLRLDDSARNPYLLLAQDSWIKSNYLAAGDTTPDINISEDSNVLRIRGIEFDRVQHVFPHKWKCVEKMNEDRTRVRLEWKWYSGLSLENQPYGRQKTELRTAFINTMMLGRTIMREKNALPDVEFRFNIFLNKLVYEKRVLKHPEVGPRMLLEQLQKEAQDSDSEDVDDSSDSEIAEEDKYFTVDLSEAGKSKIASNEGEESNTSETVGMIDLAQMLEALSQSDKEVEWTKADECVNYPSVYFVTKKGSVEDL